MALRNPLDNLSTMQQDCFYSLYESSFNIAGEACNIGEAGAGYDVIPEDKGKRELLALPGRLGRQKSARRGVGQAPHLLVRVLAPAEGGGGVRKVIDTGTYRSVFVS